MMFAMRELTARQAEISKDARQIRGDHYHKQHPHQGRVPANGSRATIAGTE
jgi:hypothetical protein